MGRRDPAAGYYDPRRFDPREGIGYLVTRVRRRLLDLLEPEFAALGLTPVQAIVVMALGSRVALTAADFCRNLQYDPGAMTRVVDRLERLALVRRVRLARDRRTIRLELTPRGRRLLPALRSASARASNVLLARLGRAEARRLLAALKRLLEEA